MGSKRHSGVEIMKNIKAHTRKRKKGSFALCGVGGWSKPA